MCMNCLEPPPLSPLHAPLFAVAHVSPPTDGSCWVVWRGKEGPPFAARRCRHDPLSRCVATAFILHERARFEMAQPPHTPRDHDRLARMRDEMFDLRWQHKTKPTTTAYFSTTLPRVQAIDTTSQAHLKRTLLLPLEGYAWQGGRGATTRLEKRGGPFRTHSANQGPPSPPPQSKRKQKILSRRKWTRAVQTTTEQQPTMPTIPTPSVELLAHRFRLHAQRAELLQQIETLSRKNNMYIHDTMAGLPSKFLFSHHLEQYSRKKRSFFTHASVPLSLP
jgi:hypothetical protein